MAPSPGYTMSIGASRFCSRACSRFSSRMMPASFSPVMTRLSTALLPPAATMPFFRRRSTYSHPYFCASAATAVNADPDRFGSPIVTRPAQAVSASSRNVRGRTWSATRFVLTTRTMTGTRTVTNVPSGSLSAGGMPAARGERYASRWPASFSSSYQNGSDVITRSAPMRPAAISPFRRAATSSLPRWNHRIVTSGNVAWRTGSSAAMTCS